MKSNKALGFIFLTVLIDVIGLGIIIPVVPTLIRQLTGCGLSEASSYGGWLSVAYSLMLFLCSPILGGLSDRFGRRPVLLLSLLGLGIDYIFMSQAPTLAWLFVGRIIAGTCGASFSTATAYIADISTPEKRAQNFGMIGAAFGLGFIIGPSIGSLCSHWGTRVPFLVSACFSLLNFVYGYFILPESLSKENRRKFDWNSAIPGKSLFGLRRYPIVAGLVVISFLIYLSALSVQSTWTYYTMLKFNWDAIMVGISLSVVGLLIAIVQGGLIRVVVPKLGQKRAIYLGLTLSVIGLISFASASAGWMMFLCLIPYCLGGISGPALQGLISSQVPANAQGELQGALTSLMSIAQIVGPLVMNNLFSFFTGKTTPVYFPGAAFVMGAILLAIAILLAMRLLKKHLPSEKKVKS